MPRQRTIELNEKKRKKLIEKRDHDKRPYVRERCAAILKVAAGQPAAQVARQGLLRTRDADTVYNWLNIYETEGLKGLIRRQHGGYHREGL